MKEKLEQLEEEELVIGFNEVYISPRTGIGSMATGTSSQSYETDICITRQQDSRVGKCRPILKLCHENGKLEGVARRKGQRCFSSKIPFVRLSDKLVSIELN